MNTHKHARLTFARRLEMVKQMTLEGVDAVRAAAAHGVTAPTARKWLGRYLAGGEAALADASSRPTRSPRAIDATQHTQPEVERIAAERGQAVRGAAQPRARHRDQDRQHDARVGLQCSRSSAARS